MQLDWVTGAAQVVNFLVLVWLLHRFLYKPVIRAVERREERIKQRIKEAEESKKEAEAELSKHRSQREEFEQRRDELLREAEEEADKKRQSLQEKARSEVDDLRKEWRKRVEDELGAFRHELRKRTVGQFFDLAERVLHDLADAKLIDQIAQAFSRRLDALEPEQREKIIAAHADSGAPIVVRSRFELPSQTKGELTRKIHDFFGEEINVSYEAMENMPGGIELQSGSQTVCWHLEQYLNELEERSLRELASLKES